MSLDRYYNKSNDFQNKGKPHLCGTTFKRRFIQVLVMLYGNLHKNSLRYYRFLLLYNLKLSLIIIFTSLSLKN